MKVVIRADASSTIGSGHVMRCRTLADELARRGATIRFICREQPGNLAPLLRDAGYAVAMLPAADDVRQAQDASESLTALGAECPDWLLVDHYALGAEWESRLRPRAGRILAIDDLADRAHDCDVLLDQNWCGADTPHRYDGLTGSNCRRFLGPRYALLQPVFAQIRKCMPRRDGELRRVLIFMGAVDSGRQTLAALQALTDPALAGLAVDVVIGGANRSTSEIEQLAASRPHTTVHRVLPNLAALMTRADLILGAGGSTTWERCCLGVPGIAVIAGENQRALTEALADAGIQLHLGEVPGVTAAHWRDAITALLSDPARLRSYAAAALRMTDGLGAQRIAAAMAAQAPALSLRPATAADEELLLDWASDAGVRNNAFSKAPITAEVHHTWFRCKLADGNCMILIGHDRYGMPVGQVRFDLDADTATVDVSVDPAMRGCGAGELLMQRALDTLRSGGCGKTVIAEVLLANTASQRMFERLGFQAVGRDNSRIRYQFQSAKV
jgi:UDP-2,4-diacetamido-2,4,6-trideoxy-beta-L-altropyranose hydrolase